MENTKYVTLPIAGSIAHGIRLENGAPKELGHFIAKTNESQLEVLTEKFKNIYGDQPLKIKIKFFSENPLSIKKVRYNQSGTVCYCMDGSFKAKQKVKNEWKEKDCLSSCEYAMSNDNQKPACVKEATLKFLIPEISLDRIWIMKIRGITVISRINDYLNSQRLLENSIKGDYYLYLTKIKQDSRLQGKSFTNYVLDIVRNEENDVENQKSENSIQNLSTENEKNVENQTQNIKKEKSNNKTKNDKKQDGKNDNKVVNIENKKKSKKDVENNEDYNMEKCYYYLDLEPIVIENKGKKLNYMAAKLSDMQDKQLVAVINNELANELKECDLGTILELELKEISKQMWVTSCKFIQKFIKKVAA